MTAQGEMGSRPGDTQTWKALLFVHGVPGSYCARGRGGGSKHHRQIQLPLLPWDKAQQLKDITPESIRAVASQRSSSPGLDFYKKKKGTFPPPWAVEHCSILHQIRSAQL